jgi:hypothetical protein
MDEILHLGFLDIENEKVVKLDLSEEQKKQLGFNKQEKNVWDYYDSYLIDIKTKDRLHVKFEEYIDETLPKKIKASCAWCNGKSKNEDDKKCNNYKLEGSVNLFFATWWYVNIVENNKHLLSDKFLLNDLSIRFYECFLFKEGRVSFNLRKLTMFCLEKGFLTLSRVFASNDKIQNLEIINKAIEDLGNEYLSISMFEKKEPYHIEPQKEFFKNKRKSIKEQLKIEKLKKKNKKTNSFEKNDFGEVLKKNENEKIFKNDFGFTLFMKMFEIYKSERNKLANFSFVFYAMEKDFLVCSQTEFVIFLSTEKYNIQIDKVDSRQSGKNKKSNLYNSILENLKKSTEKAQL